jgi:hypothetical protein
VDGSFITFSAVGGDAAPTAAEFHVEAGGVGLGTPQCLDGEVLGPHGWAKSTRDGAGVVVEWAYPRRTEFGIGPRSGGFR